MEFVSDRAKGGEWKVAKVKGESFAGGRMPGLTATNAATAAAGAIWKCSLPPIYGGAPCWLGDLQQDWGDDMSFEPH
jgi:hypothetical protein